MVAYFEYQSQMIGMTHSDTRMSSKVIQKYFNNRLEIMENQGHCLLKSSFGVLKAKRHFLICKSSPRTNKCSLMLVLRFNLYLIVSGKTIHKGKNLATYTLIQNLINKWFGEIVLRIGMIQIMEISSYADHSLLLIHQNGVWNPLYQGNRIDETRFQKLLYICLNCGCFPRIHRM